MSDSAKEEKVKHKELLEISDVSVSYGKIRALRNVSVDVNEGEHVAVLGPNGAGKTTLMRTVMGHVKPESGKIRFNREDVTKYPPWERAKKGLAVIPEGGRVFPNATVKQNLMTGAYLEKDDEAIRERLKDVYKLFPRLEERKSQWSETLSGGEQQMLAIGRAVMMDPELLLVDEITMGLMPTLVKRAFEVLADLNNRGIAILQVEQNVNHTLEVADRIYVLENGRVVEEGTPEELASTEKIEASYLGKKTGDDS